MGIKGLLPMLGSILKSKNITAYKQKRIAIDAMCWVHAIATMVSHSIYNEIKTEAHIEIFEKRIKKLLDEEIVPVFVFDGDRTSFKEATQQQRKERREKCDIEVKKALELGNKERALTLMKQSVEISADFLYDFMLCLNKMGIEFIIAPYEADAQLTYLCNSGYVDAVMTEDSDLIIYGCNEILFKYKNGKADVYDKKHLNKIKNDFLVKNMLEIAILSGCDYLPSIKGVGLLTAVKKFEESNGCIEQFLRLIKVSKKVVPDDYLNDFLTCRNVFKHHIVYDPITSQRIYLNSPVDNCVLECLGTLKNLPFVILLNDGSEINIKRHFMNGKEVAVGDEVEITKINNIAEEYEKSDIFEDEDINKTIVDTTEADITIISSNSNNIK